MNKIKLFCLPFAGGSKIAYREMAAIGSPYLEVVPLELPGRGTRFKEPQLTNVQDMVEDVLSQIRGQLHGPYAIYGHSMGALLTFLLAKKVAEDGLPRPLHLFVSGREAPSVSNNEPPTYLLPKEAFLSKIRELGGSPEEILQDQALMDFFEPILRADFQAVETFQYEPGNPLQVPMTVLIGDNEGITLEEAQAWQLETIEPVLVRQFPGNHFFILHFQREIMQLISQTVTTKTISHPHDR